MAIHFDKDYNAFLRKEVRNYNKRRNRLEARGFKNLPSIEKVSELKARYSVRSDLDREIKRLRNFRRGDILQKVETEGGVKAVSWQLDYIKGNVKNAKEYFEREYERVSKRTAKFPGERTYLDTIRAKIDLLEIDVNYMSQDQFRSALAATREFASSPSLQKARYRGFLSEVEWVMDRVGISEEKKKEFFSKFEKLTPSQFLYAYDNNDIIARIYNLYFKKDGVASINTSNENAEDLLDTLMAEADDMVEDAKLNAD